METCPYHCNDRGRLEDSETASKYNGIEGVDSRPTYEDSPTARVKLIVRLRISISTHQIGFKIANRFVKSVTIYVYAAYVTIARRRVFRTLASRTSEFTASQFPNASTTQEPMRTIVGRSGNVNT